MLFKLKTIFIAAVLVLISSVMVYSQAILQDATALLKQDFFTSFTEDKTEYLGILKNYTDGTIKITNSRNRQTAIIKLIPYSDDLNLQPNTVYLNQKAAEKIALSGKSSFVDIVLPHAHTSDESRESNKLFSDDDTGDLLSVDVPSDETIEEPIDEENAALDEDTLTIEEFDEGIKDVLDNDATDEVAEDIEENVLPDWLNTDYKDEISEEESLVDEDKSVEEPVLEDEILFVGYDTKYGDSDLLNLDGLEEDLPIIDPIEDEVTDELLEVTEDIENIEDTVTVIEDETEDITIPDWTNDLVVDENADETTEDILVTEDIENLEDNDITNILDDIVIPIKDEIVEENIEDETPPVLVELTDDIPEIDRDEDNTGIIYFLEPSDFRPPVSGGKEETSKDNVVESKDEITVLEPVYEPISKLNNLKKGSYYLQSAAFSSKNLMDGAVKILKDKGLPVFTLEKNRDNGGVLYKVLMGPFTRDEIGVTVYQLFYSGYQDLLIFRKR